MIIKLQLQTEVIFKLTFLLILLVISMLFTGCKASSDPSKNDLISPCVAYENEITNVENYPTTYSSINNVHENHPCLRGTPNLNHLYRS